MTIGISIDNLLNIDPWQYDNQQDVLNAILEKCTELDPWKPLDENTPKDGRLLNIGKWTGVNFEWIHAAFLIGDEWHLPFDSERDENGTPVLSQDEQPTHWKELTSTLK